VYTTDANIEFEAVVGLARLMQLGGRIPEFVVVGIGYPLAGNYGDGLAEFGKRRARDLTSTTDERYGRFIADAFNVDGTIETGGSEQFLGFIADELLPLIEGQYRLDPDDRTLLGHSAGGHFALLRPLAPARAVQQVRRRKSLTWPWRWTIVRSRTRPCLEVRRPPSETIPGDWE
jgi:predicted alpha/beta superfamily hydrolase